MDSRVGMRIDVVDMWKRLYEDMEGKDVRIITAEGEEVGAHRCVLSSISEPFKKMLSGNMLESQNHVIKLEQFTSIQVRFFLRLAYTGHVHDDECRRKGDRYLAGVPSHKKHKLTDMLSDTLKKNKRSRATEITRIEMGSPCSDPESDPESSPSITNPPLELLMACAKLSKMYEVTGFVTWMLELIKPRVNIFTFNEIACLAIAQDMARLRLYCIKYAEDSRDIRKLFDNRALCPEVLFELESIWKPLKNQLVEDQLAL